MSIRQLLQHVLENYRHDRETLPWGKNAPIYAKFMHQLKGELEKLIPDHATLKVEPSVGNGKWAAVPWVAYLDRRETDSIRKGLHVIFLFREDMSGVYLAMGMGITEFKAQQTHDWRHALQSRVAKLRVEFDGLSGHGFQSGPGFDLRAKTQRGMSYGTGVILHKLYERDRLPTESEIRTDIGDLLAAYDDYIATKSDTPEVSPGRVAASESVPEPTYTLADVVKNFAEALTASHISFGATHTDLVRSFVASLATKRFVILTGLSGSGKTQIAIRFGEWLGDREGDRRSLLVPVRPDWTGAEALFGYEDALLNDDEGRRAWHVPEALAFMLKAARDQTNPYLLVLDEMNLAHVERYFADVLSGMESDQPCLPNLYKEKDGLWRCPTGKEPRIPFPRNLFVVGTVNVDETTYMFSPKVLDRANTFEFRVTSKDLQVTAVKPTTCGAAPHPMLSHFLQVAKDDQFQVNHPATDQEKLAEALQQIHDILAENGSEFGHRVFYEALRFAALLEAAGNSSFAETLDRQVMQKILPRLHGTVRRLEPTLRVLGQFCWDLKCDSKARFDPEKPPEGEAKLALSFNKVRRMTKSVRTNQFASFTE